MIEVLTESIHPLNLPFTVLLGLVIFYWIMVILGAADMHAGDAHVEVHADADLHADVHADAHADADGHGHGDPFHASKATPAKEVGDGFTWGVLKFLNIGAVPVIVVLSVLVLCLWMGSMIANHYFTGGSIALAAAFLIPNLVISMVLTRYITMPLRPLFRMINRDYDEDTKVIGQPCTVVTSEANASFGQGEVRTKGAPILINIRTLDETVLSKGSTAVVVREDREKGVFFVVEVKPVPGISTAGLN